MKVKVAQFCLTLQRLGLYSPWNSLGQNTGVGSFSLLQEIFPTQGLNLGLLTCRYILYQLSHKGSSRTHKCLALVFVQQEANSVSNLPRSVISWLATAFSRTVWHPCCKKALIKNKFWWKMLMMFCLKSEMTQS